MKRIHVALTLLALFITALPVAAADLVISRAVLEDKSGTLSIEDVTKVNEVQKQAKGDRESKASCCPRRTSTYSESRPTDFKAVLNFASNVTMVEPL